MTSAATLARLLTFTFTSHFTFSPSSLASFLSSFGGGTGGCGLVFVARVVVLRERNAATTDDRCERKNDH